MIDAEKLFEFYKQLIEDLEQSDKDLVKLISRVEDDSGNQSKPVKEHILKLQLYGYDITVIQTLYSVCQGLFGQTTRPGRAYKYLPLFTKLAFEEYIRLVWNKLEKDSQRNLK